MRKHNGLLNNPRAIKIYDSWRRAHSRCSNPKDKDYKSYGAKGITVDEEWTEFIDFYRDMEPTFKPGLTLERLDGSKGYSQVNCRLASRLQQANNRPGFVHQVTLDGQTHSVAEWSRMKKLGPTLVYSRVSRGMSYEDALTIPPAPIGGRLNLVHF